jgi:hypothetical protein
MRCDIKCFAQAPLPLPSPAAPPRSGLAAILLRLCHPDPALADMLVPPALLAAGGDAARRRGCDARCGRALSRAVCGGAPCARPCQWPGPQ